MIKRLGLLKKRPDLDVEAFRRYWLEVHAPLIAAMPGVRAYRQNHTVGSGPDVGAPLTEEPIDGVVEIWFDDEDAMKRAYASPEGERVLADIPNFIDRLTVFVMREHVITGPAMD